MTGGPVVALMRPPLGRPGHLPDAGPLSVLGKAKGHQASLMAQLRCAALPRVAAVDRGPSWRWRFGHRSLDPGPVGRSSLDAGRFGSGWCGKPPRTIQDLYDPG